MPELWMRRRALNVDRGRLSIFSEDPVFEVIARAHAAESPAGRTFRPGRAPPFAAGPSVARVRQPATAIDGTRLLLVRHAMPVIDPAVPAERWRLGSRIRG